MNHSLKIDDPYLKAKLDGDKLFEIRFNDRGYQKGDTVTYKEYRTGQDTLFHTYQITYVSGFNQKDNYVVFGEKYLGSSDTP